MRSHRHIRYASDLNGVPQHAGPPPQGHHQRAAGLHRWRSRRGRRFLDEELLAGGDAVEVGRMEPNTEVGHVIAASNLLHDVNDESTPLQNDV